MDRQLKNATSKGADRSTNYSNTNNYTYLLQSLIFLASHFSFLCKEDVCVFALPWFTHIQEFGLEFRFFLQVLHTSVGEIWNSTISERKKGNKKVLVDSFPIWKKANMDNSFK